MNAIVSRAIASKVSAPASGVRPCPRRSGVKTRKRSASGGQVGRPGARVGVAGVQEQSGSPVAVLVVPGVHVAEADVHVGRDWRAVVRFIAVQGLANCGDKGVDGLSRAPCAVAVDSHAGPATSLGSAHERSSVAGGCGNLPDPEEGSVTAPPPRRWSLPRGLADHFLHRRCSPVPHRGRSFARRGTANHLLHRRSSPALPREVAARRRLPRAPAHGGAERHATNNATARANAGSASANPSTSPPGPEGS